MRGQHESNMRGVLKTGKRKNNWKNCRERSSHDKNKRETLKKGHDTSPHDQKEVGTWEKRS
jgi:hypothetical protein